MMQEFYLLLFYDMNVVKYNVSYKKYQYIKSDCKLIEGVMDMFKIQEIREIIRLIDQSTINEFTYENEGTSITLKKNNGSVAPQNQQVGEEVTIQAPPVKTVTTAIETTKQEVKAEPVNYEKSPQVTEETNLLKIESPMVGTFYAAPSPDEPPYVQVGDKVKEDSIVCIVEAMKLFNEIEAEIKGEIVEVLAENGQLVEYGQPLFLVKPE